MKRLAVVVLVVVTLAACATFSLKNVWREPDFKGSVRKVLVLGISRSDTNRRIFEDNFARALQSAGVPSEPAYPRLPDHGQVPNDGIKAAVAQSKADAILITRVVNVETEVSVTPTAVPVIYSSGFYGWYDATWSLAPPPSINTYKVLTIETTLWDMHTGKAVWTATTKGTDPTDVAKATADLAKVLIGQMKKDAVI